MAPIVITKTKTNATNRHTLVANDIQYEDWDRCRIENYLNRIGLNGEAKEIAKEIEKRVFNSNSKYITTKLIREICDSVLFEKGLISGNDLLNLSVPVEDVETFLFDKSNENSNMSSHNPEATAFFLSGLIAKQYAFQKVFSKKVADAHKKGQIYIHDLDMVWRAYCSVHSPALILKHGLDIPDLNIKSAPPRNCRALIGQVCSFLASMQAYYAGAMALGYVNTFFAPLTKDLPDKELEQSMQHFIFQLSQTAFSRGAQTLFVDLNLYIETPSYLRDVKAIGPGGKELDITYGELEDESHRILRAMFKIAKQGDAEGKPFFFPKLCLHISKRCFEDEKYKALLLEACDVASVNGSIYFIFDYVDTQLAACCRLRADVDEYFLNNPLEIRFCGAQNVSINFPQIGYRLKDTSYENVVNEVKKMADLCILAHKQKKRFLKRLMKDGCMKNIGLPLLGLKEAYLDLDKATYIVGIIGLNDLMHCIRGKNMHEDENVFLEALQIISELETYLNEKSKEIGMKLVLEETPGEQACSTASRKDLQQFEKAKDIIRGTLENPYYTNSIHFIPEADISLVERIRKQSMFHQFIRGGAIIHAFVGEELPPATSIYNLLEKVFDDGNCQQLVFSPEFTICNDCKKTVLGMLAKCEFCGSDNVYNVTRIVGYYSRVQDWHNSKKEELRARQRGNYK